MSLQISDLTFEYNSETRFKFPDIALDKGEQHLILGNSGKGKTTLLHLMAGILKPSSGHIQIGDTDISNLSSRQLDHFRGKHIGLIFQRSYFVKSLSVKDNLLLAQKLGGHKEDVNKIRSILQQMNVDSKINQLPSTLSIGEQQRVSIARAVINQPKIILADEPSSALDDENSSKVAQLLENTAKDFGATLVIVTHDQRLKSRFNSITQL